MRLIFLCLATLLSVSLSAQVTLKEMKKDDRFQYRNSVQLELGGHGVVYSANFERNILNFDHFKSSVQMGLSFYPGFIDIRSRLWVPFSLNQIFSLKQHHLETGVGMVVSQFQNYAEWGEEKQRYENRFEVYPSCKIGYRYQKPAGRMVYKVLFTPLFPKDMGKYEFIPWGSMAIGYNF